MNYQTNRLSVGYKLLCNTSDIKDNLTQTINYNEMAKIMRCSTYQFQRMFAFMNDIPLSEYIRKRKMSLAVVDLQNGEKIIDISLKYGYSSPTAFNRAFQKVHGVPPSKAREKGIDLKSYPPINFKLVIKGTEELNYRIERKKAFRIIGTSLPLYKELEENFKIVPKFWDKAVSSGTLSKLLNLKDDSFDGFLGISACGNNENWKYYIAVSSSSSLKDNLEEYDVPSSLWAVFKGSGTNKTLQELEKRVITEWLPYSGYDYGDAPDIEHYIQADPQNAIYEYWLPIQMKKE